MRHLALAALAATTLALAPLPAFAQDIPPPPTAPAGATPEALLDALIAQTRHTATIENGRLKGEGGDFLRALGARSQFVMLGESHGNVGVADYAAAYWRDLNDIGFNYAVIEVDPWVARAAERELRAGGVEAWARFAQARGGAFAAPFLTWGPEAAFASEIVTRSKARRAPALWGVDQVFIGSARWQLRDVAATARDAPARAAAAALVASDASDMNWLKQVETAALQSLRTLLTDRRDADQAALVEAMIVSQRIYRPFTGGEGEAWVANTERERLMRRLFAENYSRAEAADRAPPRVMIKLGSNHVFRGAAPNTMVQGFGGFVSEFATTRGTEALAVLTLCGPGGSEGSYQGPASPCIDDDSMKSWNFLLAHADPASVTIFDLRPWRLRPRRWAGLPADVQRAIASYDVLVFAPRTTGSAFLPGLAPPADERG